jgi:hypothetical protein
MMESNPQALTVSGMRESLTPSQPPIKLNSQQPSGYIEGQLIYLARAEQCN